MWMIGVYFSQIPFCSRVVNIPISQFQKSGGFLSTLFCFMRKHLRLLFTWPFHTLMGTICLKKNFFQHHPHHTVFLHHPPRVLSLCGPVFQEALHPHQNTSAFSLLVVFWVFPCLPDGDMDWGALATPESDTSGPGNGWCASLGVPAWFSESVAYQGGQIWSTCLSLFRQMK